MAAGQHPKDSDVEGLMRLHRGMLRVRRFEERASQLYRDGEIPGFLHLSIGQEAVAVGVCSVLRPTDAMVSTHRGHGHCLAKGVDMGAMFAELMGRSSGSCCGLGGSMHIADIQVGAFGANGIVGAGLPIGTGIASALRQLGRDDAVVIFFGEGAVAQGAFHETLNLAAVWRLPTLFLCENNQFAEFSRLQDQQPTSPVDRAPAYGIRAEAIDGNDVRVVAEATRSALIALRSGEGPRLIEARTYRWHGHYEGDPERYRTSDETEAWKKQDPLLKSAALIRAGSGQRVLDEIEGDVDTEVAAALRKAHEAPSAYIDQLSRYTIRDWSEPGEEMVPPDGAQQFRYMDALNEALSLELERDPAVWVAGIDVGMGGGVFGVTRGLAKRFPGRILDTPISETAVMGLGVGGAIAGTKPVVELMYIDFLGVCLDQILNQAAKLHFMTGGRTGVSLVVRTQFGAGRSSGPQHSQSLESIFTQIPGLKVVMPADAADAYGLLRAAIHDPNPVIFIENRLLYSRLAPRPPIEHVVPLGSAKVRRPGLHLSIVCWSRIVHDVMEAAESASEAGIEAEVIDLRSVAPIDRDTIAESVRRTNRLLIVHEAVITTGVGAELAAWAADELFWDLDVPVRRIAPPFTPVPYARELEAAWLPTTIEITEAILSLARM